METEADTYQRMFKERMEKIENILLHTEYFFTNTEDACGEEIYKIFKKAADISNGLLTYSKGESKCIEEITNISIAYILNISNESKTIQFDYQFERGLIVCEIANQLNQAIKNEGYKGIKYFYDISQDVDMSGLAFSDFAKELKLYESEVLWRGNESENSEVFEDFWSKINEHKGYGKTKDIKNENLKLPFVEEVKINTIKNTESINKDTKNDNLDKNIETQKKPWWKIW